VGAAQRKSGGRAANAANQRYTAFKQKNARLNSKVEKSIKSLDQAARKRRTSG